MSVSLFEMLENLSYNTRLGDEADHSELATAALTKERVDFVHPRIRSAHLRRSAALRAGLRVSSSAGWGRVSSAAAPCGWLFRLFPLTT